MSARERPLVMNAERIIERRIAVEALARLSELFAVNQADRSHHSSIGFSYIANRLYQLAALPGELQ